MLQHDERRKHLTNNIKQSGLNMLTFAILFIIVACFGLFQDLKYIINKEEANKIVDYYVQIIEEEGEFTENILDELKNKLMSLGFHDVNISVPDNPKNGRNILLAFMNNFSSNGDVVDEVTIDRYVNLNKEKVLLSQNNEHQSDDMQQ